MSRFPGKKVRHKYHYPSIDARNRVAELLRDLVLDNGHFLADMDRYAGWWAGRMGRVTTTVPFNAEEPWEARYHLSIEDVFEIGRFLDMSPSETLDLLSQCLREGEDRLPEDLPVSDDEVRMALEEAGPAGERVEAERSGSSEENHNEK